MSSRQGGGGGRFPPNQGASRGRGDQQAPPDRAQGDNPTNPPGSGQQQPSSGGSSRASALPSRQAPIPSVVEQHSRRAARPTRPQTSPTSSGGKAPSPSDSATLQRSVSCVVLLIISAFFGLPVDFWWPLFWTWCLDDWRRSEGVETVFFSLVVMVWMCRMPWNYFSGQNQIGLNTDRVQSLVNTSSSCISVKFCGDVYGEMPRLRCILSLSSIAGRVLS